MAMSHLKTYFIGGVYGVGKSTLVQNMKETYHGYSQFSASDLISQSNNESYGSNKFVKDADQNQVILIDSLKKIRHQCDNDILLAGHFCIVTKNMDIDILPSYVFKSLSVDKIVVLTSSIQKISMNLLGRDDKKYDKNFIKKFQDSEIDTALKVSKIIGVDCLIYDMEFSNQDLININNFLRGDAS